MFSFKKISLLIAALMMWAALSVSAQGTAVVDCDVLNFRSEPSSSSKLLGQFVKGNSLNVVENLDSGWSEITYNGIKGFVSTQYIKMDASREIPGYVNTGALNLRVAPSINADIIMVMAYGQKLNVCTDGANGWYKICAKGKYGYVSSQYITLSAQNSSPAASSAGQKLAEFAKKYLGTPYVYGGISPSGFDCSGFVKYVYSNFGIEIPRVAADQSAAGVYVARSELAPGDVVCFNNGRHNGVNHVGIYVGNGEFIHSPTPGEVVRYDSINSDYYNECYYNARRFY